MGGCPGQNTQFWGPDAIFEVSCPKCKEYVEFFKDDSQRKCKNCGEAVFNPRMDFSCAKWCPSAKTCLGEERYNSLVQINKNEEQRKNEFERLLASIRDEDKEVKVLFKKLYMKNKSGQTLFDVKELYAFKIDDPKLFEKATKYFSEFTKEAK